MVVLFCAVVGEDCVVTVDIEDQQAVGVLKERIKRKEGYRFPSSRLTLYLAKQNGVANGAWMTTAHPDYARLSRGDAGVEATYLTTGTTGTLLDPTWSMEDYFAGAPNKKVIHVLVKLPDDRSATLNVPVEGSPLLGREVARTTKDGVIKRVLLWFIIVVGILLSIAAIVEDSVRVQEKPLAITKDIVTLMSLVGNAVGLYYKE